MAEKEATDTTAAGARWRGRVAKLEQEKAELVARASSQTPSALVEVNQELVKRLGIVEERLRRVEEENRDFADMYVRVQEQYVAVTNLYVASYRLHATLEPDQVMQIIMEILVELVGAEEFGIFLLDEKKNRLRLVAGEGARDRVPAEVIPAGDGVIGEVALSGQPFFFDPGTSAEQEARLPLATIPLNIETGTTAHTLGVIVIYQLLRQKAGFSSTDLQILELLAGHAATALVSARLHHAMDRKLKTIEGFMQLMTPRGTTG